MTELLLQPWSEQDLPLLEALMTDPQVMAHLGGPDSLEKIAGRHQRYLNLPETDHMFKIIRGPGFAAVGSIGYWKTDWHDQDVFETGWFVLPAWQGQGIATGAGRLVIERARRERRYQSLHAFPAVANPASNAICRKLGFELVEQACQVEYPIGHFMAANNWRLDLFAQ
jgi:RimJ/RimL family protein N-acetyltransferase